MTTKRNEHWQRVILGGILAPTATSGTYYGADITVNKFGQVTDIKDGAVAGGGNTYTPYVVKEFTAYTVGTKFYADMTQFNTWWVSGLSDGPLWVQVPAATAVGDWFVIMDDARVSVANPAYIEFVGGDNMNGRAGTRYTLNSRGGAIMFVYTSVANGWQPMEYLPSNV